MQRAAVHFAGSLASNSGTTAHWYGIIRKTLARSPSLTNADFPSLRFRFLSLRRQDVTQVRCPRFTFPVPVFLKRLAAPLCVFNFGINPQLLAIGNQRLANTNILHWHSLNGQMPGAAVPIAIDL